MQQDRPLLGILLMLGFCALAPLGDAVAKLLGQVMPILHLITVRFAFQAIILVPVVIASRRVLWGSGRIIRMTALRTVLHIAGIGTMFTALKFLPLADAVAIAFVMPFIMLLLGKYVLGEEVGPYRLAACVVGFIGTLMVIQPNFTDVGAPALMPLGVAVIFALFMLVTRQIAKEVDPIGLQASSAVMACLLLMPVSWLAPTFGLATPFEVPGGRDVLLLIAMGSIGTSAHLLMTWSLRYAPSATLAPMQYLEIPMATIIGWLIFRDLPNGLAGLGIVITMAAGLYVIWRERVSAPATTGKA